VHVGICSIIWKERLDIFAVLATAARIGAEGVEVWGQPPHVADPQDLDHARRLRDALRAHGLTAPQYGSYAAAGRADFGDRITADLNVTRALGARACRIWAGTTDSELAPPTHWQKVVADLRTACAAAAAAGLLVTLERHQNTVTNSLWGCQRVLDEVGSPALRLNYQATAPDTRRIREEIRVLAPHILNCHATNQRQGAAPRTGAALAAGDIDWNAVILALQAGGMDGFIEVEFVRREKEPLTLEQIEAELAADVAFLKSAVAAAQ